MKIDLKAPVNTLFAGSQPNYNYTVTDTSKNSSYVVNLGDEVNERRVNKDNFTAANYVHADMKYGNNSNLALGATTTTGSTYYGYYWPYYDTYKTYYYPLHNCIPQPDKFETAFKLARKLMDKKLTKPMRTIEDFFKLMDSIVEVL